MIRERATSMRATAGLVALVLVVASCGGDDDGGSSGGGGNELVDGGTLTYVPASIDPAFVYEAEAARVTNALYDGLVEWDFTDRDDPQLRGLVAESWEPNDDATQWTFTLKAGMRFSNGDPVLPSSFERGWQRAADPDLETPYGFLFGAIDTIDADDDTRTLAVTLAEPNPEFPALTTHVAFSPMPAAVDDLDDQSTWDQGVMVGNGPFVLEKPRDNREIVVVRNEQWGGDIFGNTTAKLNRIRFRISRDVDSAWQAFEAGRTMTGAIPAGSVATAVEKYANTADPQLAVFFFGFNMDDPVVGGDENLALRQAIALAIDRDQVNEIAYGNSRDAATSFTPPGVPGFEADLCDLCRHDPDEARELFQEWLDDGNALGEPIRVQFNSGQGHEDAIDVVVGNLRAVGIDAVADPRSDDTYIDEMFEGGCQVCRLNWQYDYPSYDYGLADLFTSEGAFNLFGVADGELDALVAEARVTVDDDFRWQTYRDAELVLLDEITAVVPVNWYNGDYAYSDRVEGFVQTPLGMVLWEQVSLA